MPLLLVLLLLVLLLLVLLLGPVELAEMGPAQESLLRWPAAPLQRNAVVWEPGQTAWQAATLCRRL